MVLTEPTKKIHLASDHAGFESKEIIREWLLGLGYEVLDHGAKVYEVLDDFPDYISLAAAAVSVSPDQSRGIIFGGSGQGEAILANRYPNVRATVYYGGDKEIIRLSREHNDANMLSIGARFVSIDDIKNVIETWLMTSVLPDEKYNRRNKKIETLTRKIHST